MGSDHSFYHRQTRNTRKQWTKNAPRASALERKRYESTQSARDDEPTSVGVVEAAGSSPVTQTMSSVHNGFQLWTLDFFMLKSLFSFLGYVSEQVRLLLFVLPWQSCYAVRYCTATPFLVSAVWFRFLSPPEISIYPTNR